VHNSDLRAIVDWRALQRWHIPESALPSGSIIRFREPTLWEQGRKYFLSGIAIIFAQTLLILGLFWQRARRRQAEIALERSEEKFSKAFRHGPLAITLVRMSDDRYLDVNDVFEAQTGWTRADVIGRTPLEIGVWVDPDQRVAFMGQLLENGHIEGLENRFRRKNGQIRTGLGSAELIQLHGEQCALSIIADITERKLADEAMASFGGRLIEAQEAERTRIARELHDDITQRLAMVALSLDSAKSELPANHNLVQATTEIDELGDEIQALSHRLHSSKLEILGLEAAASGFCSEISQRQNVRIDFCSENVPKGISDQIALCLFRVLQEAIQNAIKHSGVDKFEVFLCGVAGEIKLCVQDSGSGFDPSNAHTGYGLGLTSMKERLRSLNGELSIDSEPGHGTTIIAHVKCEQKAVAAQERAS
jgi:PAS domain S-box-containing protein